MKEYEYLGDLHKDIKQFKKNGNFDWKKFLVLNIISIISALIAGGIVVLIIGRITSSLIGSSIGVFIWHTIKNIKESRQSNLNTDSKIINLYKKINEEDSDYVFEYDAKEKIKKCVSVKKSNKIIECTNTMNPVLSNQDKIVRYFYLLDLKDKLQVLRQIKGEYDKVYLLEKNDIKIENLEIPSQKIFKKQLNDK